MLHSHFFQFSYSHSVFSAYWAPLFHRGLVFLPSPPCVSRPHLWAQRFSPSLTPPSFPRVTVLGRVTIWMMCCDSELGDGVPGKAGTDPAPCSNSLLHSVQLLSSHSLPSPELTQSYWSRTCSSPSLLGTLTGIVSTKTIHSSALATLPCPRVSNKFSCVSGCRNARLFWAANS